MSSVTELLQWSPWYPLSSVTSEHAIPRSPGLYRVRRVGWTDLDYIGQTGMLLKRRLAMLKGVYATEMPYRDPHTAAPALWALRHSEGCDFEVSVVPVVGSTPWRKGLEALAISLYRQQHGQSPTVEFGRVPTGYLASSHNNSRLVRLGKRFRGGLAANIDSNSHAQGVPPNGPLTGHPQSIDWCGHPWSGWLPLTINTLRGREAAIGLYRLRGDDPQRLVYIGQGKIANRLLTHLAKLRDVNHPQGIIFAGQNRIECSWVQNDKWLAHQRLELENDLIAAHLLHLGDIPAAQFLG